MKQNYLINSNAEIKKEYAQIRREVETRPLLQRVDSGISSVEDLSFYPKSFSPRNVESKSLENNEEKSKLKLQTPISLLTAQQKNKKLKPIINDKFRVNRSIGKT